MADYLSAFDPLEPGADALNLADMLLGGAGHAAAYGLSRSAGGAQLPQGRSAMGQGVPTLADVRRIRSGGQLLGEAGASPADREVLSGLIGRPLYEPPARVAAGPQQLAGVDPASLWTAPETPTIAAAASPGWRPSMASTKPLADVAGRLGALGAQYGELQKTGAGQLSAAAKKSKQALTEEAGISIEIAEGQAKIQREGMAEAERIKGEYVTREVAAQQQLKSKMAAFDAARVDHAAKEIDPGRRYSGGSRVGAAISMALGALGASKTGGPNLALQIIQGEIDRDIAAQEQMLAKGKDQVAMAQTEVGIARQLLGDEDAARKAAETMLWDGVRRQFEADAAQYKSPQTQVALQKSLAAIDDQTAVRNLDISGKVLDQQRATLTSEGQIAGQMVSAQQRNIQLGMAQQAKVEAAKMVSKPPPGLVLIDPGYKPTDADTKKAQEIASAVGAAIKEVRAFAAWRAKHGAKSRLLSPGIVAEGRTIQKRAMKLILVADKAGGNVADIEAEMTGVDLEADELGMVIEKLQAVDASLVRSAGAAMLPYGYGLSEQRPKQFEGAQRIGVAAPAR